MLYFRGTDTVCQHYRLKKLVFKNGKSLDFSALITVIQPTSLWTAQILEQGPDGLFRPVSPKAFDGAGEVKEIQYTLTAWNGQDCIQEDYRHPIEHKLILGASGMIRKSPKLFEKDNLNAVLRTKAFPGVKCVQFVC